jgi:hypothetical protein
LSIIITPSEGCKSGSDNKYRQLMDELKLQTTLNAVDNAEKVTEISSISLLPDITDRFKWSIAKDSSADNALEASSYDPVELYLRESKYFHLKLRMLHKEMT